MAYETKETSALGKHRYHSKYSMDSGRKGIRVEDLGGIPQYRRILERSCKIGMSKYTFVSLQFLLKCKRFSSAMSQCHIVSK